MPDGCTIYLDSKGDPEGMLERAVAAGGTDRACRSPTWARWSALIGFFIDSRGQPHRRPQAGRVIAAEARPGAPQASPRPPPVESAGEQPRSASAPAASAASVPAPLPRYRFVALGVVWSAYLVVFLSRLCVGPLSPFLKEAFDLSNAQIGGLTSATAVAYAPTLIFAGWLVDRIGVRRALLIGTLDHRRVHRRRRAGAVATASCSCCSALSGLGCGFIYPSAVKAIMLWFPPQERATAVGVNQSAVNVSGMLGAAIMPALAWRAAGRPASSSPRPGLRRLRARRGLYRDPEGGIAELRPTRPPEPAPKPAAAVCEIEQGLPCVTGDERADRAARASRLPRRGALARHPAARASRRCSSAWSSSRRSPTSCCSCTWTGRTRWSPPPGCWRLCQAAGAVGKPLSGLVSDRLLGRRRRAPLLALAGAGRPGLRDPRAPRTRATRGCCGSRSFCSGVGAVGWGGLFGTLAGETAGAAAAGAAAGVTAAIDNVGIFIGPPLFGLHRRPHRLLFAGLVGDGGRGRASRRVCSRSVREPRRA